MSSQRVAAGPARALELDAINRSDADRAALISRLYARADGAWLAELLTDLEGEDGEPARLRLADEL
jgi:hypothetical protein